MTSKKILLTLSLGALFVALVSCLCAQKKVTRKAVVLEVVGLSDRLWTGVAVSQKGRIFVNYPRWSPQVPFSVGELVSKSEVKPFPDQDMNEWQPALDPKDHFICVQSVYVDGENYLWILDAANPLFQGVIKNGPKLLKIDLQTDQVVQKLIFKDTIVSPNSYLNDVRVDPKRQFAYITDSGLGALVVVNLKTGVCRRVLTDHASTKSENTTVVINNRPWLLPDGSNPQIHADGIALNSEGTYLYYQALTGRTLYRIRTEFLRTESGKVEDLASKVEKIEQTGVADGLLWGLDDCVYLSALETSEIKRLTPAGKVETVVQDQRLAWPDSFSQGADGSIYVSTSQIHLAAEINEPFRIFRFQP
ncbi:L-dopachrome tautomerase-related protein [candidate division CSSED10-310 bacterium]|uniref:L-dopachrome tautomerase-related protein n=1 Tax=candidate division CSSED10-310 bacterium TaxID=2855610 RepID=A0ABV6Z3R6_UNCC1